MAIDGVNPPLHDGTPAASGEPVDTGRRRFLTATTAVVGAVGAGFVAVPFIKSWNPSERAKLAGAPVTADISALAEGQRLVLEWRGQPIWIVRRSTQVLQLLPTDMQSDVIYRVATLESVTAALQGVDGIAMATPPIHTITPNTCIILAQTKYSIIVNVNQWDFSLLINLSFFKFNNLQVFNFHSINLKPQHGPYLMKTTFAGSTRIHVQ